MSCTKIVSCSPFMRLQVVQNPQYVIAYTSFQAPNLQNPWYFDPEYLRDLNFLAIIHFFLQSQLGGPFDSYASICIRIRIHQFTWQIKPSGLMVHEIFKPRISMHFISVIRNTDELRGFKIPASHSFLEDPSYDYQG